MLPRKEYPRPQFVRKGWMNLNGEWQFEIDHGGSGRSRGSRLTRSNELQPQGYLKCICRSSCLKCALRLK